MAYSDYIVYVDESGDPSLTSINPRYPVFVLAFCVFRKDEYAQQVVTPLTEFKFNYFGHDQIILHERDIRKRSGPFKFLNNPNAENEFHENLGLLVSAAPFTLITGVINKTAHAATYSDPSNP